MTERTASSSLTHEMQAINRELADLVGVEPVDLALGSEAALVDDLVICGILGGKDVGKSTLINALAREPVSVDAREVGRGTERPMVFVHGDVRTIVGDRLSALGRHVPFDVALHRADPIRNVVLVDLPDFDSEFREHLQVVRVVAPLLDRVLWVQTPRKIGDRVLAEMFHDVIKDAGNVLCVLNKVDELLADGDLPRETEGQTLGSADAADLFWRWQSDWVARVVEGIGFPRGDEHRFLVAAAFSDSAAFTAHVGRRWGDADWSRYESDHDIVTRIAGRALDDLDRLRAAVLGPVSADQARCLKEANRRRERQANTERIRRHYDVDGNAELLSLACDAAYHQQVLAETVGANFAAAVAARLAGYVRPDTALADELLEHRLDRWPLLRLAYWPFGWLSRALGRRFSASHTVLPESTEDPFEVEGRSLLDRAELVRSRVLADHAVVASRLRIDAALPTAAKLSKNASSAAAGLIPRFERGLLEGIYGRDCRPGFIGKAALWFVLLWFPFLQPVLEGALAMYVESGAWHWAHGAYRVVSAFSAAHLLMGFAVVAAVYVAVLAGMYARGLRAVRSALTGPGDGAPGTLLADSVDEVLVVEILVPLIRPFQDSLDRLSALQDRLDRQSSDPA